MTHSSADRMSPRTLGLGRSDPPSALIIRRFPESPFEQAIRKEDRRTGV